VEVGLSTLVNAIILEVTGHEKQCVIHTDTCQWLD
jgi:hypothetical protein